MADDEDLGFNFMDKIVFPENNPIPPVHPNIVGYIGDSGLVEGEKIILKDDYGVTPFSPPKLLAVQRWGINSSSGLIVQGYKGDKSPQPDSIYDPNSLKKALEILDFGKLHGLLDESCIVELLKDVKNRSKDYSTRPEPKRHSGNLESYTGNMPEDPKVIQIITDIIQNQEFGELEASVIKGGSDLISFKKPIESRYDGLVVEAFARYFQDLTLRYIPQQDSNELN
jgi:hypothetical protein